MENELVAVKTLLAKTEARNSLLYSQREKGRTLLAEAYQACQIGLMDNSLTRRIQEYLITTST